MAHKYGEPQYDLTPLDLFMNGYVIRQHPQHNMWCWSRQNPYGEGEIYGAPYAEFEDVYAGARWLMSAQTAMQPTLIEVVT